MWDTTKSTF
uniref:Uncharacterized protein n=1 Tax=Anguilla anguilla TaxID=7936 RepID=A0A0E9QAL0_ANGAN